ncbi:MAG TPA: hypothetical protein VK586_04795 [Streptosporangiaceae bacterium]|nr:hypothetical protein [Streptosporangiaceae bacterium]
MNCWPAGYVATAETAGGARRGLTATDLECDQMILSPDDHRSLQAIDGELATCEPHLAGMFRIFGRLNSEEAPPPSEDLIVAVPPADPTPRRGWRGWRPAAAIVVPAVLLVTVLTVVFTLTSSFKCRPAPAASLTAARSSTLVLPGTARPAVCRPSTGIAKTGAHG